MPEAAAPRTDPSTSPAVSPAAHRDGAPAHPPADAAPAAESDLAGRVRAAADGLGPLVAQAEAVRRARSDAQGAPRWTDVFTTQFTEFSNRPR
jgi:hypothetical protein